MVKFVKFFLLLTVIAGGSAYFLYQSGVNGSVGGGGEVYFVVETGEGVKQISARLKEAELIDSSFYFEAYIWRSKQGASLQAGSYALTPSMSIVEIVESLVNGESLSRERTIKIIEGWRIADIDEYLKKNSVASNFSAMAGWKVKNWNFNFARPEFLSMAPAGADLEGYIFPDTYRIFKDASADNIIEKTLANFNEKFTEELREEIKRQGKSIHDIVTMASIIEKEVREDKDRAIVSGVLYKRLEIGMRLEVDSTINYITGKNDPAAEARDLEIDSPYNTYKYYGLPPGPICNPGLASVKAAIYPEKSPYLFYLNRQDTGETIFSKTHDEHVRNKNKYLR